MSNRYDICPECGEKKRMVSETCKTCQRQLQNQDTTLTVNHELLTHKWITEFRGFFVGEGCAAIIRNNTSYAPMLTIKLRDDDADILLDIQHRLGGRILYSKSRDETRGSQISWRALNVEQVLDICNLLLDQPSLPAKKLVDIALVKGFCEWRLTLPRYWSEEDRTEAERRLLELQAVKRYPTE